MRKRIGVFICHCGSNIASTVDIARMKEELQDYRGVVHCEDYPYLCSDPGQKLVQNAIGDERLDGIVCGCCSPTLHEATFRNVVEKSGLNRYQCEIANIREQCSWVHEDPEVATPKATRIVKAMIEKVRRNQSLAPIVIPVVKRALVIGGGISGIQAALDIAEAGIDVTLVESSPSIGGRMAQLSETFPTLDCSQCILTPKMVQVSQHPRITLMTYSEIDDVSGYVGNFNVKIRRKARYVILDKCTGCGDCATACPQSVPNEFNRGFDWRKAIYLPFPQAVPSAYCLDREACLGLMPLACTKCRDACGPGAIDYDMQDQIEERNFGAIIVATGYDLFDQSKLAEYGYGQIPDVIDGLQFERLLSASGPTHGVIRRPSDGQIPKEVVFVQCVGSRDPEKGMPYCSKICCMYTAKHALLYRHKVHDGQAYVFYIDVRSAGKGYEEFVQKATEEERILYLRGKVSKIFQEQGKVVVWGADTLTGRQVEVQADLVVLALAVVPNETARRVAQMLKVSTDDFGFFSEAHPKLRPVESLTPGIFLAGCAQSPRDIPETVAQASGSAVKGVGLVSSDVLYHEPIIAGVDEDRCAGCGICVAVCPYHARQLDVERRIVKVTEVLCQGCGACSASCPAGAADQKNLTDDQIRAMIYAGIG